MGLFSLEKVSDFMNPRVKTLSINDSLGKAAQIMIDYGYDYIPVIDQKLLGEISSFRLVDYATKNSNWSQISIKDSQLIQEAKLIGLNEELDVGFLNKTVFVIDGKGDLVGVIAPQDILSRQLLKSGNN
jgi:predicted transcriptional regulator